MDCEERIDIPKPEGYHCFACGTANPIGLNLKFYRSGDTICSDITLGKYYVGWSNISHGGIISTLLDEVMSWTILYFKRIFFVTRKMEVKYIKPVLVGTPLTISGRIIDQKESSRNIKARAELRDNMGNLLARSTGDFVTIQKEKLSFVSNEAKQEIFSLIEDLPPL
ncbi:PaaI family thioesterase [Thermodesulfobacteriota bacterium]